MKIHFNKIILRYFVIFLLISTIIILVVSILLYKHEVNNHYKSIKIYESNKLYLQVSQIVDEFVLIQQDVFFLHDLADLSQFCSDGGEQRLDRLGKEYLKYIENHRKYDQIRLLDIKGKELVRAQNSLGKSYLVPKVQLQDKSERYYFQEAVKLKDYEIYFSKFDLNIENGELEIPYKPVIRVGIKVYSDTGEACGVVLVNYLGKDLGVRLNELNFNTESIFHLLDPEGYFLISDNSEYNWGFMLNGRENQVYSNLYPGAWETIKSQKEGQFLTPKGLFTFRTLSFNKITKEVGDGQLQYYAKDDFWKVVSLVPNINLERGRKEILVKFYIPLATILILVIIFSFILANYIFREEQNKRQIFRKNSFLSKIVNLITAPLYVINSDKVSVMRTNLSANDLDIYEKGSFFPNQLFTSKKAINKIEAFRQEIIDTKKNKTIEITITNKDGVKEFYQINGYPIVGIENDDIQILEVVENKTKEKFSDIKFKDLLFSLPQGMIIVNEHGVIEMVNKRVEKLFLYSSEELIGQNIELLIPLRFSGHHKMRQEYTNKPTTKSMSSRPDLVGLKKNGEEFPLEVGISPIKTAEGTLIAASIKDITERKKYEEKILNLNNVLEEKVKDRTLKLEKANAQIIKSRESLKEINAKLEMAFSTGKIAWWEIDLISGEMMTTILFSEMLGYKKNEVRNSFKWWQELIHKDDKDEFEELITDFSSGKKSYVQFTHRLLHKQGHYIWFQNTGKIVDFGDDQKPLKLIGTSQDVSIRKKAEEEIINAKNAAESANIAKSEFLANMSHEIRTPMNAVIGFSEQLSKSIKEPKQLSQITAIKNSGRNLLRVINDILDFSKIEADKIEVNPGPVSIKMLAVEIKEIFALKAEEKDISLFLELDSSFSRSLVLDEARIRQILFNLVGNAVKFTDKGHVNMYFEEKSSSKDNTVDLTIVIEDTGIGISDSQRETIFDPFIQQKNQNVIKYGGTGLGLSITKKLVEKMGGKLSLESEEGVGSKFIVKFSNVPLSDVDIEFEEFVVDSFEIEFEPATVLVVDDVLDNRKIIVDLFEESNLKMVEAENGQDAVDYTLMHIPDLILMDLRMPVMDGYEAARILKNHPKTSHIPIMALTASIKSLEENDIMIMLFDEHLIKPIDLSELLNKVKSYLKHSIVGKEIDQKMINDTSNMKKCHLTGSEEEIRTFIHLLDKKFLPEYKKVLKTQVVDDIEMFGKELLEASVKLNCEMLIDFCNKIEMLVDNFEFDHLIYKLHEFPGLVEVIKSKV